LETLLQVKNLTKIYDNGTVALTNINFEVKEGEFLVVIGLSGSGKSTLLRCINRLIDPTEGEIWLRDQNITTAKGKELRHIRRRIGMIFQQFNLVKRSSVMTNVLTGRLGYIPPSWSLANRFSSEDKQKAREAIKRVGIPGKANIRVDELSGGQQQRVGIARALMQDPELILADEPVASLDPVLAYSIMDHLEQLNKQDGRTIICSLHYLDLVQRYADRVIGLRDGHMVYEGDREHVRKLSNEEFANIYGEEAQRLGSITGN
jgi:phosphonate transport system ATP-binding protein